MCIILGEMGSEIKHSLGLKKITNQRENWERRSVTAVRAALVRAEGGRNGCLWWW